MAKPVKVKMQPQKLKRAVKDASAAPLAKAGALVEAEAKRSMAKGGRIRGRKTGVPSDAPDPPHVQQGSLRASVAYAHDRTTGSVVVGPTEWYGKVHEYGGRLHPKRPFMRPALLRMQRKFAKLWRSLKFRSR